MEIIRATNVNTAYRAGLRLLAESGEKQSSRAGDVLVTPFPVVTVYQSPRERVLFEPSRDANPFFHLMESLWMLAGRRDADWLDQFVKDFSKRFAEEEGIQHGAYGYRWRQHFAYAAIAGQLDQLDVIIGILRHNPNDRRVVLQMWDAVTDLSVDAKDVPCNISVLPRIVHGKLDITVTCRSNDAIWGAYGANAVHFSVLQEYLAANLGIPMGTYYQISNNFHAYLDVFEKKYAAIKAWESGAEYNYYRSLGAAAVYPTPLIVFSACFDDDLRVFMDATDGVQNKQWTYMNPFFPNVAIPMFDSYKAWRQGDKYTAINLLNTMPKRSDWYHAAFCWYQRRLPQSGATQQPQE